MSQDSSVSLVQAAATLRQTYRAALDLVLRGALRGHQDENRRWLVDRKDLERVVREREARDQPLSTV